MKIHPTPLEGLMLLETVSINDDRGRFTRVFCETECTRLRPNLHWQQINISSTVRQGSIRGMHFQHPPAAEAKLIRCTRGRVFDVAVDLRSGSSTFLQWHAVELTEDGPMQFFIPEGFAHGFQTLTPDAQLLYMHSAAWSRSHENTLRYDDPAFSIKWPLAVEQVSEKDRNAALLDEHFTGISLGAHPR